VLLRESPNKLPFPKNARAVPQVVTIASPSPSTRSFVCGAFSRAAIFISSKLCMVTIFGACFVPEFDMNREYRGMLRAEKITEGAPRVPWACLCCQTTKERPLTS
jgi:hypothetical protein